MSLFICGFFFDYDCNEFGKNRNNIHRMIITSLWAEAIDHQSTSTRNQPAIEFVKEKGGGRQNRFDLLTATAISTCFACCFSVVRANVVICYCNRTLFSFQIEDAVAVFVEVDITDALEVVIRQHVKEVAAS